MGVFQLLKDKKTSLAVVGLGYVGMPLAVEFSKKYNVIGFDVNEAKVRAYREGRDATREVGDEVVKNAKIAWTTDETALKDAKFIIVAVPTPINTDTTPDLSPVIGASEVVGRNLTKGTIVVFESTVYPGVTEETCLPILERESGLKCGPDFKIGYSPERINPGDKVHRLTTVKKIVSGCDNESLNEIADVYGSIIEAGVHRAQSIKVAEAAKVVENSQRDLNIALMNELSMIFHAMDIDTLEVLEAAGTKWNFLKFYPGLVGGHCIGVDPYYLTFRAEQFGYHSQVVFSGRRVNDGMPKYVAEQTVKQLIATGKALKNCKIGCLGITFKENCPDPRNSKVNEIIKELRDYGVDVVVCDPVADAEATKKYYGVDLAPMEELRELDCLIIAVAHREFLALTDEQLGAFFKDEPNESKVLVDVKGTRDKDAMLAAGYRYWRL